MQVGKCFSISDIFVRFQLVHLGKLDINLSEVKFTRHGQVSKTLVGHRWSTTGISSYSVTFGIVQFFGTQFR